MKEQTQAVAEPFVWQKPKHLWVRVTNCETPGRFQVIVEVNGGDRNGGQDRVIYDSINECDGNISHHINLSQLVNL